VPLRPELQSILDTLLAKHPQGPTLDDLSDATWDKSLDYADIDALIAALEQEGFDLEGSDPPPPPEELMPVMAAARALTQESGKRPSIDEIATRSGLPAATVRRALRLLRSVGAPK
jgi:hypothetical protein